jgi:hypothetical protein
MVDLTEKIRAIHKDIPDWNDRHIAGARLCGINTHSWPIKDNQLSLNENGVFVKADKIWSYKDKQLRDDFSVVIHAKQLPNEKIISAWNYSLGIESMGGSYRPLSILSVHHFNSFDEAFNFERLEIANKIEYHMTKGFILISHAAELNKIRSALIKASTQYKLF